MRNPARVLSMIVLMLAATAAVGLAEVNSSGLSSADVIANKPPSNVVPPPPNPNVILQGGDTCDTATVIGSLPYSDSGTTVGYTNDYDEVCPFTGSTSPDVVYSYTPATDTIVDVTLCTGTTDYDTKLYAYQGTCASGTSLACADDSCAAPLGNPFASNLQALALTAGQTYYFVVDGYGGASGPYTIEVTERQPPPPPVECDGPDLLYYQTVLGPDDPWNAFTSGQTTSFEYEVLDNFTSDLYSISDFHWWGLSLFFTGAGWDFCDPTGMTFDLTFYADAGGQPGAAVCSFGGLTPTAVNTGASYSGYTLYYWEVTGLSPACEPLGPTWVSIKSFANAADCAFLWMNAAGGDATALQYDGLSYSVLDADLALCLTGTIVPVELQSIDIE